MEPDQSQCNDQGFPRRYRLLNSRDFQRVFEHTEYKSSDRFLTLLACRNQRDYPRLGLAVTKKKIRTSVARHRLKRIIRESFRRQTRQLVGLDVIVMGTKLAQDTPNQMLFKQLEYHWRKLADQLAHACDNS